MGSEGKVMGFRVRANIQACGGGGAGRPKTEGKSEESNILKLEYGLENLICYIEIGGQGCGQNFPQS